MAGPWKDQAQADQLLSKNLITPQQYSAAFGVDPSQPQMTPAVPDLPQPGLGPVEAPPVQPNFDETVVNDAPPLDPDEARMATQRAFWDQKHAKEDAAVHESELAAEQAKVQTARDDLEHKKQSAFKLGYSPEEVQQNLGAEEAHVQAMETPPVAPTSQVPAVVDPSTLAVEGQPVVHEGQPEAQQAHPLLEEYNQSMKPYQMQDEAIQFSERVGMAKAAEESSYQTKLMNDANKRMEKDLAWEDEQRTHLDSKQRELEDADAKVSAMKIDPDKFWASRDTNQKILTGIGLFLGGIGAGKTGVNGAVRVIENAINRDIQTQKDNIQNAKDGVGRSYNLYSMSYSRFKDEAASRSAARVRAYTVAQNGLNAIASKYKGAEVQANAMALYAELEQKKNIAKNDFIKTVQQRQMAQGLARGMSMNPNMLPEGDRERFVAGYGLSYTKEGKKIADDAAITFNDSDKTLGDLIKVAGLDTATKLGPETLAQVKTDLTTLRAALRNPIIGPGAVSESEWKLLDEILADPTRVVQYKPAITSLMQLRKRLTQKKDNIMRQHIMGYQPLAEKFGEQPYNGGK